MDVLFAKNTGCVDSSIAGKKGEVGRQYTTTTTFPVVLSRLKRAFNNLSESTIRGCMNAAEEKVYQLHTHLQAVESNTETCDSSDYDSESTAKDD
ncbi:hypothetical protein H310_12457 [Aphanomyces invadans]|uniref:COG complex component COG2 C-terminal domain-containing protein n=1 Tax=Aphanomyces invadans TaxID=157072 RepID=A0A024TJ98_9STRA|nr:hypothetical protein H310_12457 [Aphanomyces invadans]ETV93691.1 hypothetical protein H310_12457 [Aphanomyces invadans]|eukprot:XP_008877732.1 hypothetical protein H310_12457 [Aphanomyces invadans]